LQKKTEIRAKKKVNLRWHRDKKEKPISAPSIHVGALVGAVHSGPSLGLLSPPIPSFSGILKVRTFY